MKKIFPSILLLSLSLIFYCSCKKSENSSPNNTLLIGQWEMTQYGIDTNNNGLLDKGETSAVVGFGKLLVFYETGDYNAINIVGFSRDTVRGQWSLIDNSQTLQTISAQDTAKFTINALTNNNLTLRATSTGSNPYWQIFKKN